MTMHVTSVEIHTPYEVTVTANTTVGAGVPVFQVVFSEQGGEHIMCVPGSMETFLFILHVACGGVMLMNTLLYLI